MELAGTVTSRGYVSYPCNTAIMLRQHWKIRFVYFQKKGKGKEVRHKISYEKKLPTWLLEKWKTEKIFKCYRKERGGKGKGVCLMTVTFIRTSSARTHTRHPGSGLHFIHVQVPNIMIHPIMVNAIHHSRVLLWTVVRYRGQNVCRGALSSDQQIQRPVRSSIEFDIHPSYIPTLYVSA